MKRTLTFMITFVMLLSVIPALTAENASAAQWVYFSNQNDVSRPYRVGSDGKGLKRLGMQSAVYMEVAGDWIYYCSPALTGGAFRTSLDGATTETLIDGAYNDCYGVYLDNGNIYLPYICHSQMSSSGFTESNVDIYTSKGFTGTQCIDRRPAGYSGVISRFVGACDNRLYYRSADGNSYYGYTVDPAAPAQYPGAAYVQVLPPKLTGANSSIDPAYSTRGYFCRKYLRWSPVKNAEGYRVYVKNKSTGKYSQVAETKDTYISLTVRSSAADAEYMVTGIRGGKSYKAKLLPSSYNLGNSPANTSNGAISAELEGDRYVCLKDGIYRFDSSGGNKKKLSDMKASFLNVIDGKLYFASGSDIYRMEADGTGLWRMTAHRTALKIYDSRQLEVSAMAASGKNIFLSIRETSNGKQHTLILKADDSAATEVSSRKAENLSYIDGRIIYKGADGLVYSIDDDIEYNITVSPVNCVTAGEGVLYYGTSEGIFSMNSDGTNVKKVSGYSCDAIAADGKKIYFIGKDPSGSESWICKISTDGSGYRQLVKTDAESLNIIGSDLYYRGADGTVYKCGTSSSQAVTV